VRNMCDAVGHPVVRLRRVRIGPIHDPRIRPGEFRDLSPREIAALKAAADLTAPRRPRPPRSPGPSQARPSFPAERRARRRR
jgi:hypothetical protein